MDPVNETINTYNLVAESYKQRYLSSGDKNNMKTLLDEFVKHIKAKAKVP